MKKINCTFREFSSLDVLADKAKMDWWFEESNHSVASLNDLYCALLVENLERMEIEDVMQCYEVFVRYNVIDNYGRMELLKYFGKEYTVGFFIK